MEDNGTEITYDCHVTKWFVKTVSHPYAPKSSMKDYSLWIDSKIVSLRFHTDM